MSFGFDFNKQFSQWQGTVSDFGSSITPFAKRTRQMLHEKLGNAEELTVLPDEYLELERRVEALKDVHARILGVSSVFENEGYDCPPNIKESLGEIGRSVHERVTEAASAHSANELGSIFMGTNRKDGKKEPKSLYHALGRALAAGNLARENSSDALGQSLTSLAQAEMAVGDLRVEQDERAAQANAILRATQSSPMQIASRARKNVHNARLNLDAAKTDAKSAREEQKQEAQTAIEQAEDEFVNQVEEAVSVMKNLLDSPETTRALALLAQAQLTFFENAAKRMNEVVPELEKLQEKQELAYREARQA